MLIQPSQLGNLEMASMLVDAGADVEEGMPHAVNFGRTQVASYLISKGADGSKQEYLITAVNKDFSSLIPVLINAGGNKDYKDAKGNSLLHIAAEKKFFNSCEELIKAGCNIHAKNNDGNTVLHVAARKGKTNLPLVERLVEKGCDINAVNAKGKTVRKYARGFKVKKFLKSKGALRKIKQPKK